MPNKARTHEENRRRCCAICFRESGCKTLQTITNRVEDLIRKFVKPDYMLDDISSTVICGSCRLALEHRNENDEVDKYSLNISEHFGVKVPRQSAGRCECVMCRRARFNGPQWTTFCHVQEAKRGKLSAPPRDPATEAETLCKSCLTPVKLIVIWIYFLFLLKATQENFYKSV